VFIENLKMSTLHQMGIHETQLLEANPRLITLRIPPAGLSGDWAHYTGFGGQFDGLTGLASLCGHRGTDLMETPSTQHMDGVTAGGLAAHEELDEAVAAWAATVNAGDGFHQLQEAGVAAAPVLDNGSFSSDPQVVAREWIRPLTARDVGTFPHLGQPFRGIP